MSTITYPHIEIRDGMAYIEGTQTKVVEVVMDQIAHHWDAYEIHRQYPELGMAQIYAALAYYHDHQDELDRLIAERLRREEQIIAELDKTPLQIKLRELKRSR